MSFLQNHPSVVDAESLQKHVKLYIKTWDNDGTVSQVQASCLGTCSCHCLRYLQRTQGDPTIAAWIQTQQAGSGGMSSLSAQLLRILFYIDMILRAGRAHGETIPGKM